MDMVDFAGLVYMASTLLAYICPVSSHIISVPVTSLAFSALTTGKRTLNCPVSRASEQFMPPML